MEYFALGMETSISLFVCSFNCLFSFSVCLFPVLLCVRNTTYITLYSECCYMKRVDNFVVRMETSQFPCLFVCLLVCFLFPYALSCQEYNLYNFVFRMLLHERGG